VVDGELADGAPGAMAASIYFWPREAGTPLIDRFPDPRALITGRTTGITCLSFQPHVKRGKLQEKGRVEEGGHCRACPGSAMFDNYRCTLHNTLLSPARRRYRLVVKPQSTGTSPMGMIHASTLLLVVCRFMGCSLAISGSLFCRAENRSTNTTLFQHTVCNESKLPAALADLRETGLWGRRNLFSVTGLELLGASRVENRCENRVTFAVSVSCATCCVVTAGP